MWDTGNINIFSSNMLFEYYSLYDAHIHWLRKKPHPIIHHSTTDQMVAAVSPAFLLSQPEEILSDIQIESKRSNNVWKSLHKNAYKSNKSQILLHSIYVAFIIITNSEKEISTLWVQELFVFNFQMCLFHF